VGFEPQSSHLSILRMEFQTTRLLDRNIYNFRVSLVQLVGILHYICRGQSSNLKHLICPFLATRILHIYLTFFIVWVIIQLSFRRHLVVANFCLKSVTTRCVLFFYLNFFSYTKVKCRTSNQLYFSNQLVLLSLTYYLGQMHSEIFKFCVCIG
jgi:hypothetical protein